MGHLKIINFPFETNGKLMVLGVPILKHFGVHHKMKQIGIHAAAVVLLFYVHGKHLRLCRKGQLT